jgi:LytS/YehU family sensor histidine kinase
MLFNTLANLRALIGVDPLRAQAMLDRLIPFLRATLDASRKATHSLADEFARLADYLELMQIRMGGRLQTRLSLPDELAARPVPALLLQPLVENAIKHGLEPHVQGGRVEVSAKRDGSQLVLRVRDTGAGLMPGTAPSGFGLEQVRERLAALYGAAGSLELAPAADAEGGTLATLRLPL